MRKLTSITLCTALLLRGCSLSPATAQQNLNKLQGNPSSVSLMVGRNPNNGNLYAVAVDENGLLQTAGAGTGTATTDASQITKGTLSVDRLPAIPNTALVNGSVIINGTSVPLGQNATITVTLPDAISSKGSVSDWNVPGVATHQYSTQRGASVMGGDSFTGEPEYTEDNELGRNSGFPDDNSNGVVMRDVHARAEFITFATPGISEATLRVLMKTTLGDFGGERNFWAPICALTASSDEACKFHYDFWQPIGSYTATLSAVLTPGTEIMTTPSASCDANPGAGSKYIPKGYCLGGQRWLVDKTAAPVYSGHVTAMTFPSNTALGTMTVDGSPNFTPTVTATIPAGVPDTTNVLEGDTVTVTIAGATGTVPASGDWIINGPSNAEIDHGTYTVSGTTATLSGHRWPHSSTGGAPTILFTSTREAVFAQDQSYYGADIGHHILGFADDHTLYWTDIGGGSRTGGNLQQFSNYYTASGLNAVTIYDSAYVVHTKDPAKLGVLPSKQDPAPSLDGYMKLGSNKLALTVGHTMSELLPSATKGEMHHDLAFPTQYSAGNTVHDVLFNENVPTAMALMLANRHSHTKAGGGMLPLPSFFPIGASGDATQVGAWRNFSIAGMAPSDGYFIWQNCQGGPRVYVTGCPDDHEFSLFSNQRTGEGWYVNQNASTVYGAGTYTGEYHRIYLAHAYFDSPNGPEAYLFGKGFTVGIGGCSVLRGETSGVSIDVKIGTDFFGRPCGIQTAGNVSSAGYIGPPTAPTGACPVNGQWEFTQDGHATFCSAGTWVPKI